MDKFETWWEREGQEFLYALNTTTDDDIKLVAEIAWKNGAYCAEQAEQEDKDFVGQQLAEAIRTIKFEGDTGFRPVSEMIAEHKQDPKKAAAIEKAKMRKAEQKPVGFWNGKETAWFEHELCGHPAPDGYTIPLYTRPVRTKDLTDEDFVQSEVKSLRQQVAALKAVLDAWNNVEQEPVAWVDLEQWQSGEYDCFTSEKVSEYMTPLYTAPVRTKDLTDDEIKKLQHKIDWTAEWSYVSFARAVIAADREKNK